MRHSVPFADELIDLLGQMFFGIEIGSAKSLPLGDAEPLFGLVQPRARDRGNVKEVWLNEYESYQQARERIGSFIELYNAQRIHPALGCISPRQFATRCEDREVAQDVA